MAGGAARVGGRNRVMSWIAGIFCVGVIGALIWLAGPIGPALFDFVGETLRTIAPGTAEGL